ncbi:ankyrin repeat domain-containing protein [Pseudalkalibacillus hwajinpoensis]|uniref:ankyrin repeat domain-containing protein n=1 Tax=Guptibacillus hwajinpoensis TaxID=208199 RepID=UPI00325B01EE
MKNKLFFLVPLFLLTAACSENHSYEKNADPGMEASAEEEVVASNLSDEEYLWELLHRESLDEETFKEIEQLFTDGVDVETTNKEGLTPITYAVMNGKNELVEFLLKSGAVRPLEEDQGDNDLLLEIASEQENYEVVDMLLKMGAHFEMGNEQMLIKAVQEEEIVTSK